MKLKGYLLAALSAATYGTIPLFALPLRRIDIPFDVVLAYRFFFTALIIALYLIIRKEKFNVTAKELFTLIGLGLLFSFSSHFLFWSYDFMPVGIASTLLFMYPVFVAIIMILVFKEKSSWILWLSIALAFLGILMLNGGISDSTIPLVGIIVVGISSLSYALYIIVINKSVISSMSGVKLTFYSMLVAGIFFFTKSQFQGGMEPMPNAEAWVNLILFAVISTAISCVTMTYAVRYVGSTITAIMGALEPVVAVIIGVSVFDEPLTFNLLVGLLLILSAVTFIVLADRIVSKTKQAKVYLAPRLFSIRKRGNRRHM